MRHRGRWMVLMAVVLGLGAEATPGKPMDFRLPDVLHGKVVRLADYRERIVVVWFYSHTCTFCRNYEARLRRFAAEQAGRGVVVLAVDSTGSKPEEASTVWQQKKMGFPLLRDDRARTAAALGATTLTTVCIIDDRGHLRYVGAFDDSESGKEVRQAFVVEAVAALKAGQPPRQTQTEVYGCLIPLPE